MKYFCCDDTRRRAAIQAHATLNGIDFLEVDDDPNDPFLDRQRHLFVHFIPKDDQAAKDNLRNALQSLTRENIRIDGGERIRDIEVVSVATASSGSPPLSPPAFEDNVLVVEVSKPGDFSVYTLRLINETGLTPPANFDPILSAVDFSFKASCPSDFDCQPIRLCPPAPVSQLDIDYLAKDYASFRQLMLDRMAALLPGWQERNPSDLGIALIELFAYVGDYLSYQQDAVATEAYIGTARRRSSVRRHARLVDYPMHDGRNARSFVYLRVDDAVDGLILSKGEGTGTAKLSTRLIGMGPVLPNDPQLMSEVMRSHPQIFELLDDATLYAAHNEIKFYSWENQKCCLPKGATRATLRDDVARRLKLRPGDFLIFEERLGAETGVAADADPQHRQAVCLTRVEPEAHIDDEGQRTAGPLRTDPLNDIPVVEIEWSTLDALKFPLCISSTKETEVIDDVSVALGNIVLADHGMTFADLPEGGTADPVLAESSLDPAVVPRPNPALTIRDAVEGGGCKGVKTRVAAPRYYPRVTKTPITQAAPYDPKQRPQSAAEALSWPMVDLNHFPIPAIRLSTGGADTWEPVRDLLSSSSASKEFVAEVESDGTTYIRFGDDVLGARPTPDTKFLATYRIGNGLAGNIGRDALGHIITPQLLDTLVLEVRNPLPAEGGLDPESMEDVRQKAPSAFRLQERAVTPFDYAEVSQRCSKDIQRAAATFRWTGSWRTVFLTVDRFGGRSVDKNFEIDLRNCLESYRMAGHDLEVDSPQYVSLEIVMNVCVKPDYFSSNVKAALLDLFSNRVRADGSVGVFHPDNFTFGQPVYLSSLIAAAQTVPGVDSVAITTFQRQGTNSQEAIDLGRLNLGRLEIARLDNDPNFREHGVFTPEMRGGR
jgi:hypothetical protein